MLERVWRKGNPLTLLVEMQTSTATMENSVEISWVPWIARRSNQSIRKEICPEYSLEGLMLKLKLQYSNTYVKSWLLGKDLGWCWERLKAGGEVDTRGWDGWMASLTRWTWVWASSESWWRTGKPGVLQSMGSQRVRHNWATELNWTIISLPFSFVGVSQLQCRFASRRPQ